MRKWLFPFVFLFVMVGFAWAFDRFAPVQHNPTRPLSLSDPVGLATHFKLAALQETPEACFSALESGGVAFERLEDGAPGDPCGFRNALFLKQSVTPYSAPIRTSCPLAAGLNIWERHKLQPAARTHLGSELERIETFGTFSCRRMYGRKSGSYSEHARANAIDISGFRLSDGRLISVQADWRARNDAGRFLNEVFDGACDVFSVSLGPDYNAAHGDHFHFDMGPGSVCQ